MCVYEVSGGIQSDIFFPGLCWSIGLDYATMWGIFWCLHLKIDTIFYQNSKNFTVLREEVFEFGAFSLRLGND